MNISFSQPPLFGARVKAERTKGPLERSTEGVGSLVESVGSAFTSQGTSGINSSNIVPIALDAAKSAGVSPAMMAWSAGNPSIAGILTSVGGGSAIGSAQGSGGILDRIFDMRDPD